MFWTTFSHRLGNFVVPNNSWYAAGMCFALAKGIDRCRRCLQPFGKGVNSRIVVIECVLSSFVISCEDETWPEDHCTIQHFV